MSMFEMECIFCEGSCFDDNKKVSKTKTKSKKYVECEICENQVVAHIGCINKNKGKGGKLNKNPYHWHCPDCYA
jgi:hypothetical protein